MPIPPEPKREHPSTYFVQDRSNQEEMKRLQIQDAMATAGMGGPLAEQPDPTAFQRVLDVGCGTGGWLIELAKTTPTSTELVGVDASRTFVEYARAQAEAEQVSDRVKFQVMDSLRMLEFPNHSFDLVNLRLGMSWLRTWDWPKVLQEFGRIARPDGVIRITEANAFPDGNSPALMRIGDLGMTAFYQAGHLFTQTRDGMTSQLARLLEQHGYQQVQTQAHVLEYRAGTPEGLNFTANLQLVFRTIVPFLQKWARLPDDYEELYHQMLQEIQQPDFVARQYLLTAWGMVSPPELSTRKSDPLR
ncbi:MAG TPA: class I SAM-dependent methyltransferase [Ktedonobacteraceae bacterium]|jgi:ubiquinone/menaquinone biosynthesis C-methylase UbiE|nr:class I SAM-dependent methyltransferase [Ktedonobacteraceae bacterium]